MEADREEQMAGESLGDSVCSKGLSCILMRVAGSEESGNQEQWSTSLEHHWKIVGILKGKYTQVSAHWVGELFGVVNSRPDNECLSEACI